MELSPGAAFGPYRLVERAGVGGMAEVWRAQDTRLDRSAALKFLSHQYAGEAGYLDRFRREARAVSRLDHPNILPVWDVGEQDGWTYMVSPYVGGGTLAERLGHPWPLLEAVQVLQPLASALDYAHAEGIVHRDVKPSNVLFNERRRLLLGDFGIARMLEGTSVFTSAGLVIGTPQYMAPEQAEGEPAGPASDLYSLGVIAYELLTGRPPFMAETPLAVLRAHVDRPLPPPRSLNPALPISVEAVLLKALAKDPRYRYPSGEAMVRALYTAINAGDEETVIIGRDEQAEPRAPDRTPVKTAKARRRPLILAGAAGLGLLLLVGLYALKPGQRPGDATPTRTTGAVIAADGTPATPSAVPTPAATASATPAPATRTATPPPPTITSTPTESQVVSSVLTEIETPWGRGDWDAVIARLAPLQTRYPSNSVLKDKLYVAYLQKGRALEAVEQPVEARKPYAAAGQVDPGRSEARGRLQAIDPVKRAFAWRIYPWKAGEAVNDDQVQAQQAGEAYTVRAKQPGRVVSVPFSGVGFGANFVVEASLRLADKPGGGGLSLFQSRDSFWADYGVRLVRQSDGSVWAYMVQARPSDPSQVDRLAQWGPNPAFLAEPGQPNRLRIEGRGRSLNAWVNGYRVWYGEAGRLLGWTNAFVAALPESDTSVSFFEYLVYEP